MENLSSPGFPRRVGTLKQGRLDDDEVGRMERELVADHHGLRWKDGGEVKW